MYGKKERKEKKLIRKWNIVCYVFRNNYNDKYLYRSSCFSGSTSAISIVYKLKKKRLIENLRFIRLAIKMEDDVNAHPI